jgi:peptidoglycan/xylan/chitin deacetylase (PgdA/CDA1 family)
MSAVGECSGPAMGDSRRGSFLVTFDDGTEDLFRYREVLSERGVPAVVFVPVGLLGLMNRWEWPFPTRRARHLTANQLRRLAAEGWEVGVHGASHRDLTRLGTTDLNAELCASRQVLQDSLGRPVRMLAYPFGRVDRRVATAAAEAGYHCGFVVSRGPLEVGWPWAVVRRPVYCIDTPEAVLIKVSDPSGRTWRGRWERRKERVAHAVGRRTAVWRR